MERRVVEENPSDAGTKLFRNSTAWSTSRQSCSLRFFPLRGVVALKLARLARGINTHVGMKFSMENSFLGVIERN
jgi:hypothetical protein